MADTLLILGCGYIGEAIARSLVADGQQVLATTRSPERAAELLQRGVSATVVASPADLPDALLQRCDAVLDSIPLARVEGALVASQPTWLPQLAPRLRHLRWAGYLSATSVYGDSGGAWVDEDSPCHPSGDRGAQRLLAEGAWLAQRDLPAEIFRLAAIYGPTRSVLPRLRSGPAPVVRWEPPRETARIHCADVVRALRAALARPRPGRVLNLCDDDPVPHDVYIAAIAERCGTPPPRVLSPHEAEEQLSPALLDFFRDHKRVANRRLHDELLPALRYPSFRTALDEGFPT